MLYQRTFLIELNLYTLMSIVWIIPFETIRRKAFQKTVRDLQNEICFNKESTYSSVSKEKKFNTFNIFIKFLFQREQMQ